MKPIVGPGCKCCSALRTQLLSRHLLQAPQQQHGNGPVCLRAPIRLQNRGGVDTLSDSSAASIAGGPFPVSNVSPVTVKLPDGILEQLQQIAREEECDLDQVLTYAAEMYVTDKRQGKSPRGRIATESLDSVYVLEPIITLVDGLLHGEHTVAQALTHGDTGLGTLDLLDGEVVVYQGVAYHQSSDGAVRRLNGHELTPFMTLCNRDPLQQHSLTLTSDLTYQGLQELLKKTLFRTLNVFHVIEINGHFSSINARVVRKQDVDRPLVQVAADQALFDFNDEDGLLIGFYSPEFMGSSINVPGFHLHYLSDDRQRGGHLLDCHIKAGATVTIQEIHRVKVDLPYRDGFMNSSLQRDIQKEIEAAERAK